MPFGIELQGIEPPKGGAITAQPCVDEFLLRAAQNVDGNFWGAQLTEEVGKGVQDDGCDFQLRSQLDGAQGERYESKVVGLEEVKEYLNQGYDLMAAVDADHIILRRRVR